MEKATLMHEDRTLHHLKNHLSTILGYAEVLLAEARPDDPRREDLEEIHSAAKSALDVLTAFPSATTEKSR